jgi:hypothetical protein
MKHDNDTPWETMPTRERLAATRKRPLRSVPARGARSVGRKCRSRVIESRKVKHRQGLPARSRGGNIARHRVSRCFDMAQARCKAARPGSEGGARAQGVSWEAGRAVPIQRSITGIRTTPVDQRPGARAERSAVPASETRNAAQDSASEGNRSGQGNGYGSLRGLIVANESRRTEAGGSL